MPPFWKERPALWFAQLDAQFELANIEDEKTKFSYVVAHLQEFHAAEVEDIINEPPAEEPYSTIKSELIRRMSLSEEKRVRQLILEEELGDRKPSQFLRHLRSLAGNIVHDSLLKTLWMQRLPTHVQAILQTQSDLAIDKLATTADKIFEVQPTSTSSVNALSDSFQLQEKLDAMAAQLQKLQIEIHTLKRRNRSRSRSNSRNRSTEKPFCWYHHRFGSNAKKCESPCSYQNSGNSRNNS